MKELAPLAGGARVIGLTGSPGAGKSTVTSALIAAYRGQGLRVAVLAIDPTSPFTGGALLGDRIRMQDHATDGGVFIRSMASRGHLGGLAAATPQVIRALDAARYDIILIETVGVGQVEVEIASLADSVAVLVVPGMGDSIQAAKAGILEIADVFVVNKADRPQVHETIRDLRNMIALAAQGPDDWKPPIVKTVATTGDGIGELVGELDTHRLWLDRSGEGDRRRVCSGPRGGGGARPRRTAPEDGPAARRQRPGRAGRAGRGGPDRPLLGGGRAPRRPDRRRLTVDPAGLAVARLSLAPLPSAPRRRPGRLRRLARARRDHQ